MTDFARVQIDPQSAVTPLRPVEETALGKFHALVVADEELASSLCQASDVNCFVDLAIRTADARGLTLVAEALHSRLRPDPLGMSRWATAPMIGSVWPPRQWLPIHLSTLDGQIYVDWAHFGATPLTASFFEQSIRDALNRPFNRLFRYRMTLKDFVEHADVNESVAPSGFIFHMSRCGSTLVSQMLAALPHTIAISEAAPIDAIVQLSRTWSQFPIEQHVKCLSAIVAAYSRRRSGGERHFVVKLDSWHTLALSLFRRAFPSVPWLFLYREPIEVLVSQMRQRGAQMVAELVSPSLYGIDDTGDIRAEDYCARVLNKICASIIDNYGEGGGLLVNYRELPGAIGTRILPHFGVTCSDDEREVVDRVARYDAKAPSFEFADDTASKQHEATDMVRATAERQLSDVYRRLEDLRAGGT